MSTSEIAVGFASDNTAPVHPALMEALARENERGGQSSYGADASSRALQDLVREQFGAGAGGYCMFNGTGANTATLMSLVPRGHGVVGSSAAHYYRNSRGAWATVAGLPFVALDHVDGKLDVDQLEELVSRGPDIHELPLGAVTITQPTEYGVCYSPAEIARVTAVAHRAGLAVHMDGARLFAAAASLGVPLSELTTAASVDAVVVGGTKVGAMFGECVVLLESGRHEFALVGLRKASGQLASKMRYVAAQFVELLGSGLGIDCARRANQAARSVAEAVSAHPSLEVSRPVETNAIFSRVAEELVPYLQAAGLYHAWDSATREIRWMTSHATTRADVDRLCSILGATRIEESAPPSLEE